MGDLRSKDPRIGRSVPKDFFLEVVKGNVVGHSRRHKFGRVEGVGGELSTVSCGGSGILLKTDTKSTFFISSSSNDDANGGTGAEAVFIEGVDENWNFQTEVVPLAGTSIIPTALEYIGFPVRLSVVHPDFLGAYGAFTTRAAAGEIVVYQDAGGNIPVTRICDTAGVSNNQSLLAADIIPAGKLGFLFSLWYGVSAGKSATLVLKTQALGGVLKVSNVLDIFEATVAHTSLAPGLLRERSVIEVQAKSAGAGVDVTAGFELILVDIAVLDDSFLNSL